MQLTRVLLIPLQLLLLNRAQGVEREPQLPHYDWNICPGEGCTYGTWKALQPVVVFNRYEGHRIAELKPGERVRAITGVVITFRPGEIRLIADFPARGLRRGDRILTYAYLGEGTSVVWFNGRYVSNFDISFTTWPDGSGCVSGNCKATYNDLGQKAWWAKVQLPSGRIGWINMENSDLDGVCALETH